MEKFIAAVRKAQELSVSTFNIVWYNGEINPACLTNDAWGKSKREKAIKHLKNAYTVAIMNSRDARVRMQRDLSKLLDIEIWEPENFTDELAELAQDLRDAIAYCKEWEAKYVQAKQELKEVQA